MRLVPPGQPGVSLLILHPPNEPASGAGRVYVEYRDSRGWDRGLKVFGSDLARAGLVVHTLEDIAGADPRIWFRGSVVAGSVDTDLAVATKPVVITLDGYEDGDDGWADVTYSQTAERRIVIARANASDDIVGGSAIEERRTPCGDPITYGSWSTQSFCQFRVATTGFAGTGGAPPNVIWEVAGTVLTGLGGTALVPFDGASFFVEYAIDPISHELGLTSRGGEKYAAALTATAVEAGGGATAAATDTFAALGYFDGLSPDDAATLAQCLARIADEHRIPLPWRFRRPGPDPRFEVDPDAWGMQALDVIDTQLRFDAPAADALAHVVRLQLGR